MIPDRWYPVLESRALRGRPVTVERLGERLVVWRDAAARCHVMPAACPHRGADLGAGRVVDGQLECPWHGFRFDDQGRCQRMPCEGRDAVAPRALSLDPWPAREAHGLVFVFFGERRSALPEVPFFEAMDAPLDQTSEASYVLPYHYTRMMETNLDLHHTPFVHGSVVPVGARLDPFEVEHEGDWLRCTGELRHEEKPHGFAFEMEMIMPSLVTIALGQRFRLAVAATPIDAERTWMWFRYQQSFTRIQPIARWLSWLAVQSELRVVQRQDWRIFKGLPQGTIDDFPYRFVHADQPIGLYRKRRAELLAAAAHKEAV